MYHQGDNCSRSGNLNVEEPVYCDVIHFVAVVLLLIVQS